ncbi:TetR/AcrR family transcriptional regulator [Cryptosporangium aurantiacum]|uniref:Transcriptional regulator, TetR family n=1 Tax=Cryptosporangium aurantiacum TaxID=134849 RepID=A0A1M7PFC7_9ACTN|nr:TetR/AcrR family transcriptional regulator [Cryptosporangium aurantiacum]SHN15686.1 transcriptional regulator, TetR family [Cryptosporangium aurantiacum]
MRAPAVSREQIIAAADAVARRDGLDRLTARALCAELRLTPPAIYRHFATMELIVDQVVDDVIGRVDLPGPEVGDWADRLRACFLSVHDVITDYPGLAARMGRHLPYGPSGARNARFLHDLLATAGVADENRQKILYAVFVYVWGHLLAADAAAVLLDFNARAAHGREQFLWGLDHLLDSFRRLGA